ncbi:hypothetical protein BGX27_000879 [Mortierella sp. AM989]|nr:hypothetical protein BGX27_000879 [Mortierella sp. AM989]
MVDRLSIIASISPADESAAEKQTGPELVSELHFPVQYIPSIVEQFSSNANTKDWLKILNTVYELSGDSDKRFFQRVALHKPVIPD